MRVQRKASGPEAPFRAPPPGARAEAMLRIATRAVLLERSGLLVAGSRRSVWAAVRVSVVRRERWGA